MKQDRKEKVNFPNLRFPGFQGEWGTTTIAEECIVNPKTESLNSAFVYIDLESVVKGELIKETVINRLDAPSRAQRVLEDYDILFQCVRPYQMNNYIYRKQDDRQWVASTGYAQIRTKNNSDFFYQLLNTLNFNKKVMLRCTGTSYPAISSGDLAGIEIAICTQDEQNKIANFLTLLDDRIATQTKIIEQYKSLIKGIVDFTFMKSERKTYSIKELGESFRAMTLSKEDLSEDGNECVLYGELFTTYGYVIREIKSKTRKSNSKLTLSTKNDLLFPSSTTVDARSLISPSAILKDGVILGGDMFGIHINGKFNNEYLSYLFNLVYRNKLAQYAKGSTIIHLHYSEIKNVEIEIPLLDTQNKVIEILTLLQKKLVNETSLQSAYQKQKDYLQQEMFI